VITGIIVSIDCWDSSSQCKDGMANWSKIASVVVIGMKVDSMSEMSSAG
jgi:hypothetical protein